MRNPDIKAIQETKEQLTELIRVRLEGVKIRSRASWLEHGEKPTQYFFQLEKRMHDNKAPGPDGLSTEFYRTFWSLLARTS